MEVFSKRGRNGAHSETPSLAMMTPARLNALFSSRLNEICARFDEWNAPLTVVGRLGAVSPESWKRYEPLPLHDLTGSEEIGLEVPLELLERSGVRTGETVEATGLMRARLARGQAVLRFDTLSLRPHVEGKTEDEAALLPSLLRALPADRHDFPERSDLRLLVIDAGAGPEALETLGGALGALWRQGLARVVQLGPADRQALLQALLRSDEDVVVLMVGGEGLPLLETPAALKALAACPAYRVVVMNRDAREAEKGLAALSVCIADRNFVSPVEAGRYLRERCGRLWQEREETRARDEELAALRDSLAQIADLPEAARHAGMRRGLLTGVLAGAILSAVALVGLGLLLHSAGGLG